MSHNDNNPARSAWHHRPAVWAIIAALVLAALAFLLLAPQDVGTDQLPAEMLPAESDASGSAPAPAPAAN